METHYIHKFFNTLRLPDTTEIESGPDLGKHCLTKPLTLKEALTETELIFNLEGGEFLHSYPMGDTWWAVTFKTNRVFHENKKHLIKPPCSDLWIHFFLIVS